MTADWTTARVVRDRKGRLRTGDGPVFAVSVGDGLSEEAAAAYAHALGPLAPVLDADGHPVVTTVGDLTARHIGRMVRAGSDTIAPARILATRTYVSLRGFTTDGQWITTEPLPLDTPCEVVS